MKSEPFGPSSYITGSKEGSYKNGLIASIPHQKNETGTNVRPWDDR